MRCKHYGTNHTLATDHTDCGNESLAALIGAPEVGALVAIGARTKGFQVVAVYPYDPLALGFEGKVGLAICSR